MGAPSVPPKIQKKSGTSDTLEPVKGVYTKLEVGSALATEGEEVVVREIMIENDAGEEIVGYRETLTMTDETDGTEDTTFTRYHLINGTLTEI